MLAKSASHQKPSKSRDPIRAIAASLAGTGSRPDRAIPRMHQRLLRMASTLAWAGQVAEKTSVLQRTFGNYMLQLVSKHRPNGGVWCLGISLLLATSAQAVEYQCAPSAVLGGRASTGMVVGDKTWPYVLSTEDGDAAYWFCKDSAGVITSAQFHATTEAEKTALVTWPAHLAFWGPQAVKEQRTASCADPSKLPTAQEQRLCVAINAAIAAHWPAAAAK